MDDESKLLVWNYTPEEKDRLDAVLKEIGAPRAMRIHESQGCLTLREIVDGVVPRGEAFTCGEKAMLFYGVPQKGVFFLIDYFRRTDLPQPIYAMVTDHSIDWPFHELLRQLTDEHRNMAKATVPAAGDNET